ncbi:hypothetical protein IFM89_028298 [Coptis chinensis]|uniref:Ycf20-like protein n=1 Tax=Coptis chinensis TaxID=261450 RepID=A0A835LP96_9MAGN|nr:hypothetical protein IFM89_028298 [Coptis chinensis]
MRTAMVRTGMPIMESEGFQRSCLTLTACHILQSWDVKPSFARQISELSLKTALVTRKSWPKRRWGWRIAFALDTGGTPGSGGQDSLNDDNSGLGQTRLGRIVGASGRQLLDKLNATRKNFPMKIFLLLLGFYTANALATILGQTGDWDVLVAGVVVAAIEGIGMLMYRKPLSVSNGRFKSLVVMVNYWKAGVCLGLFVDAFKLGS